MSYANSSDNPSTLARTVSYTVNDGAANSNSVTSTINVTAVNDAPANAVPGAQTTAMNALITFSGANLISMADVDANGGQEQITLTVGNGVLNLSGTAGLTLVAGANGSASMTYQGTLANLNTALNGLTYTPNLNYSGADALSIATDDLGNTGGGPLTANSTVNITVQANQAPTLSATASNPTFQEAAGAGTQAAAVNVFGAANAATVEAGQNIIGLNFSVGGLLDGASERIVVDGSTITLGANSAGTTVTNAMGYSVTIVGNTATVVLTKPAGVSVANIDTLINAISYQNTNTDDPSAGNRVFTLSQIQDSGGVANGGQNTTALAIASTVNVVAVNDAPTASATALNPTFQEAAGLGTQAAAVNVFGAANAATVEAGQNIIGLNFTVGSLLDGASERIVVDGTAITLGANSAGTTASNGMSYTVNIVAGTATVSLSSAGGVSTANIATLINGITYQNTNTDSPSAGNRVFTLTQIQDSGGTANGGQNTTALAIASTVNVVAVNDAPTLAAPVSYAATEQTLLNLAGSGITVGDVDGGAGSETLTLSVVSGVLNATAGTTGVGVAGSGTNTLTLSGSTAQLSNLLNGALSSTLSYINNSDTPPASDTLTLSLNDNGNSGSGGAQTANSASTINIAAVNDAPTLAAPVSYAATEQTLLNLAGSGITVGDVDGGAGSETLTLSVVSGVLNATAGTTGVGVAGSGTNTLTLSGSTAQLSNLLNGALSSTLSYINNSDTPPASDTLTLSLNDNGNSGSGGAQTANSASTINIAAVNDAPVLANNTLTITGGSAVILSSANLSATDVDNPAPSLIFTMSNVVNGHFELLSGPGVPVTTFSQAAITAGQVRFVDTNSATAPAFDVTVSDGTLSVGPTGATIFFSMAAAPGGGPVIAPPPVVAPMPTPNPVLASPPPAPPSSNPAQPTLTKIATLSGGRPMVAEAVTDELPDSGGETSSFLRVAKLPRANHNPAPLLKPADLMLVVEGTDPHYVEFGPNTQVDWSAQTAFPANHHGSEHDRIEVVMESVRMGGIALSVGVVWWASRVTGLIGSLLASMPAWRHLDPLPIVGKDEDRDKEDWYEPEDSEADADELAISMVLDSPRSRDAVNA